jgi:FkbM family methyltransferase
MRVAIVDTIGLVYDGNTLSKRGLGGSESAVILVSKELSALGFDVTVFCSCIDEESREGTYDGVLYCDLKYASKVRHEFDVVISSRCVLPFVPLENYNQFTNHYGISYNDLESIRRNSKLKILWLHDTFCVGDELIEDLIVHGYIDELFTLSDFHVSYILNCDHGKRRNFEVLKNHTFITRNGITKYIDEVDILEKDKNLFVYNASVTKGLLPLLHKIWPEVKKNIPDARLKVIGGYYRFRSDAEPDEQEKKLHELEEKEEFRKLNVEFTGIITQQEIAHILAKASYFIYPGAFPETFGISSLESLYYNTPLITTKFGALEETAITDCSYFINYAIEPNGLFPWINTDEQSRKFVDLILNVYNNPYLHQQKMFSCNIVRDVCGWDVVALQWKQHFYKKLGHYLSKEEYKNVTLLNQRIHKIFGRRFSNPEEWGSYKVKPEQHIAIISPFYNAKQYIQKCILSVSSQDYENYTHYLIDDKSTDDSFEVAYKTVMSLPENLRENFILIKNDENVGAIYNQVETVRNELKTSNSIVMLLDGDDSLVNDNNIFTYYNNIYDENVEFTYGSCWSMADNIPLSAQPYPSNIKQSKQYRYYKFNWIIPYTHLRTFRKYLLDNVQDNQFIDDNGKWFRAGGDVALFYNLIEQADPNKIKVISDIVYNYNDLNPLNDYKVNSQEQTQTANMIVTQVKKKILIGIPTSKNIEVETFKSIYDLTVPDEYEVDFQYFYGYNIDQVRNLIASWAINGYDYLFSVDSDIVLPKDCLVKMLSHDVDIVSGLYIQRKPEEHILEIYRSNDSGGVSNIPYSELPLNSLIPIDGCGFGCVLIKSNVFAEVGYPQFKYHSALDHRYTVSEDVDFCKKSAARGFKLFADTSIHCEHVGSTKFIVENVNELQNRIRVQERLRSLWCNITIPKQHFDYLYKMRDEFGFTPTVIYDIGACVMHWTHIAQEVWPNAEYYLFDAMDTVESFYKEGGVNYHIGVLSDSDNKDIIFYQNNEHPGGNSYYKENPEQSSAADIFFNADTRKIMTTKTLNTIVQEKNFKFPDLVKMDIQGAELDVLKGMTNILPNVKHLILELQHVHYNLGAPLNDEVISYLNTQGFELVTPLFCDNGPDGDYHFRNVNS